MSLSSFGECELASATLQAVRCLGLVCLPIRGKANKKLLGSKNLFSESCLEQPHYCREVISDFLLGGSKTRLPSPEGGRQTKSCSDQKTYLAKVVWSGHITIEK